MVWVKQMKEWKQAPGVNKESRCAKAGVNYALGTGTSGTGNLGMGTL
jgi:hypothetical protein